MYLPTKVTKALRNTPIEVLSKPKVRFGTPNSFLGVDQSSGSPQRLPVVNWNPTAVSSMHERFPIIENELRAWEEFISL